MERPQPELAALIDAAIGEPGPDAYWLAQLIGALPIGIAVVFANDLRVVATNAALRQAIQLGATQLTGRAITELMPSEHPLATPAPYEEAACAGRAFESEPLSIGGRRWLPSIRPVASIAGDASSPTTRTPSRAIGIATRPVPQASSRAGRPASRASLASRTKNSTSPGTPSAIASYAAGS